MKYTYAYKTSDGTRHEASMNAESREAVFAALREKGIKAIKVVAADGSKANGADYGVRKRVVAAIAFFAAIVASLVVYFAGRNGQQIPEKIGELSVAKPLARQCIPGDRSKVDEFVQGGLKDPLERYLLRFAEPGRDVRATVDEWPQKSEVEISLKTPITYADGEPTETVYLKRMVAGMKVELERYLKGGGYLSGYFQDLSKRQQMEVEHREKAIRKLESIKDDKAAYEFWLKANAYLDSFGIYPIELPARIHGYQLLHGID